MNVRGYYGHKLFCHITTCDNTAHFSSKRLENRGTSLSLWNEVSSLLYCLTDKKIITQFETLSLSNLAQRLIKTVFNLFCCLQKGIFYSSEKRLFANLLCGWYPFCADRPFKSVCYRNFQHSLRNLAAPRYWSPHRFHSPAVACLVSVLPARISGGGSSIKTYKTNNTPKQQRPSHSSSCV